MPGSINSRGPATFRISILSEERKLVRGLNLEAMRIRVEFSFFRGVIDVQQRLPKLVGIVSSQLSTSAQEMLKAENHGAVAFLDIPPGSRRIRTRHQLNQVVP